MIVQAAHPAPVCFVPARARKERFVLAALRSPAELREDDLSRSVEVGPLFPDRSGIQAEPMRLLDGRLWCPVAARDGSDAFREAALAEFVDWLAGRGDAGLDLAFRRQFAGTPLVAVASDERGAAMVMSRGAQTRGEDLDLGTSRAVRLDGRERARADVARYLAEEVRVLDGRPFMRCTPFLHVAGASKETTVDIASRVWPRHAALRTFPATPETVDAALAVQRSFGVTPPAERHEAERRRWEALVPAGALDGDDVRYILAEFAEPVRKSLDNALEAAWQPKSAERLEAARRAVRGIEIASMTGTAHHAGDDAILAMRKALAAWLAQPNNGTHGQEYLARFLDRVVIPRIDARAGADLADLAPAP